MKQTYCLDTSFFINSWTQYYRRDVFPSFWVEIDRLIRREVVTSCIDVYFELKRREDPLFAWAEERKHLFCEPDDDTVTEMLRIMQEHSNFAAAGGSGNAADPWVIAHAIQTGSIVVTDEQSAETKPTRPPKIPNVCERQRVRWTGIIDFLAANNMSF